MKVLLVLNKCMGVNGIIKKETDSILNLFECAMLVNFKYIMSMLRLLNKNSGLLSVYYIEYNRKALPTYTVTLNSMEGRCQKGYKQIKRESRAYQEIYFDSMTEQLQTVYLGRYEGV